jgi:hypothetical protein
MELLVFPRPTVSLIALPYDEIYIGLYIVMRKIITEIETHE